VTSAIHHYRHLQQTSGRHNREYPPAYHQTQYSFPISCLNTVRLYAWLGAELFQGDPHTKPWEVLQLYKEDRKNFQGLENSWFTLKDQIVDIFTDLGEYASDVTHLLKKT